MVDIHAELAQHNIKVKDRDRDAWSASAASGNFASDVVNRNRYALAYSAMIIGNPLEISYSHLMGPRQRPNCWLLPVTLEEAQRLGINPDWRYNSVVIMLDHGAQQTVNGQTSWFSSDGRVKGVTRPRKLDLVLMGADAYNTALHTAEPA